MYLKKILNTIIKGDTVEELKKIPTESIDFIFCFENTGECVSMGCGARDEQGVTL